MSVTDAGAVVRRVARRHDENFPVAFWLLPADMRADMRAVYWYCRTVDDLGDRGATEGRPARLDAFEQDLRRCWTGDPAAGGFTALTTAIRRRGLRPDPFLRLLEANRMDQRRSRWDTHDELLDYCRHSATPVGELVLAVLGHDDAERIALSDRTCVGLQLVNFWQDVRRDLEERDRIYIPRVDMAAFGVEERDIHPTRATAAVRKLIAFEVGRARAELVAGAGLWRLVSWRAALDLRMFTAAGLALCDAIARQDHDTLRARPAPGRLGRARIAAGTLARAVRGAG